MITFSKLSQYGRLGNILFQIAAMFGFASKYNVILTLPDWDYLPYFPNLNWIKTPMQGKQINEPAFHATPEYYDSLDWSKPMDFVGYFQSPKYFPSNVKDLFAFDHGFVEACREPFSEAFKKPTIAIHVRRQDYVGNDCYVSLPPTYYILALEENFPDWRNCNLIFFSDDIEYCRIHYQCLPNAFFSDNFVDIADLCLMSQCDHFLIANSSFSWWGAYLGEKEGTKVVYPVRHFAGKLKNNSIRDLHPKNWIGFDHEDKKIPLKDITFTIPVSYDHPDRQENLELCLAYLLSNFDTNVVIGEQGARHFEYLSEYCEYRHFEGMQLFHRTKMLNDLARASNTPFVANLDCDVLLAPMQVLEAVQRLRSGGEMVYPYGGEFARVTRHSYVSKIVKDLDIGVLAGRVFPGMGVGQPISLGGAVFFDKEAFCRGGMENEGYISFGNEDVERMWRFEKLGFRVERVGGILAHIDHHVGINSTITHPNHASNQRVWQNISKLSTTELKEHVSNWEWLK